MAFILPSLVGVKHRFTASVYSRVTTVTICLGPTDCLNQFPSCLWGVSFCDCRNGESHRSGRDSHCRFVCSHWRIGDSHCHDVSQHRCNVSSHLKVVCSHWSIVSKHWRNGDSHCPVVGSHRCNVSSHRRIVSKQWRNGRRPAQGSPRFIGAIRRL